MSRLPLIKYDVEDSDVRRGTLAEIYGVHKLDRYTLPLTYQTIEKYQRKLKNLVEKMKSANYHAKSFRGGGNTNILIYKNDKFSVPKIL